MPLQEVAGACSLDASCLSDAGELFFFGYNVKSHPHVTYKVADPQGHVQSSVPITIPNGIMMHDFAITKGYAIFLDCPLVFKPDVSSAGGCPVSSYFSWTYDSLVFQSSVCCVVWCSSLLHTSLCHEVLLNHRHECLLCPVLLDESYKFMCKSTDNMSIIM